MRNDIHVIRDKANEKKKKKKRLNKISQNKFTDVHAMQPENDQQKVEASCEVY